MKYTDPDSLRPNKWRLHYTMKQDEFADKYCIKGLMTARKVMQIFGTDIMRDKFDKDIWVKATMAMAKDRSEDIVMITDARFPNEIDAAKDKNILTIRLHRLNYPRTDEHQSETALDDYPIDKYSYYIEAKDLPELFIQLDKAMKKEGIYAS